MGCNCGGDRQSITVYQLFLPDGTVRQFPTRQEAEAANQRAGGVGTVVTIGQ
ncbi:hypothetical protein OIU91_29600 [Streptomyces sp. NBC_01456]|uniref:DUF7196 family protein n=1 Tax=unclassified Streptomyces TaxID=2593676 RepID=UPI002E35A038|nr:MULTISPECIES: hypothetical protein [unclassified Streptomyces]